MAKKKSVEDAAIKEAALEEVAELEEELEEAKALVDEMEPEEPKKPKKAKASDMEEKVTIMIPMIEGEEPEVVVGINGKFTKIRRGVEVEVPRNVANIIKRSNYQMMAALEQQKKFENQEFDW